MSLRDNVQNGRSVSFRTLMELEKCSSNSFKSLTKGFRPGAPSTRHTATYGGHVYSQAVYAASQTVPAGFVVSSVTGFFILSGNPEEAFIYTVHTVRDGKSYSVRIVNVTQNGTAGICFTCTCSFKITDSRSIEFQEAADLKERFGTTLKTGPEDHPDAPSIEMLWFTASKELRDSALPFPGLVTKKVEVDEFNANLAVRDRRQLIFYTTIGDMPSVEDDPNLHACAHLYASDRNSLFAINKHLDLEAETKQMASLNHTVVFHTKPSSFSFQASQSMKQRWFLQEAWAGRTGDGRGLHQSKIWDVDTGIHVCTTMQDGLIRFQFDSKEDEKQVQKRIEQGKSKI